MPVVLHKVRDKEATPPQEGTAGGVSAPGAATGKGSAPPRVGGGCCGHPAPRILREIAISRSKGRVDGGALGPRHVAGAKACSSWRRSARLGALARRRCEDRALCASTPGRRRD